MRIFFESHCKTTQHTAIQYFSSPSTSKVFVTPDNYHKYYCISQYEIPLPSCVHSTKLIKITSHKTHIPAWTDGLIDRWIDARQTCPLCETLCQTTRETYQFQTHARTRTHTHFGENSMFLTLCFVFFLVWGTKVSRSYVLAAFWTLNLSLVLDLKQICICKVFPAFCSPAILFAANMELESHICIHLHVTCMLFEINILYAMYVYIMEYFRLPISISSSVFEPEIYKCSMILTIFCRRNLSCGW